MFLCGAVDSSQDRADCPVEALPAAPTQYDCPIMMLLHVSERSGFMRRTSANVIPYAMASDSQVLPAVAVAKWSVDAQGPGTISPRDRGCSGGVVTWAGSLVSC